MARPATIHAIERKDGKKRWGISIPRPGKIPKREFYDSKAERDRILKGMLRKAESEGVGVLDVNASDVQLLRDLREILPVDVDPREAARLWVKQNVAKSQSLHEASREYRLSLQRRKLSQDYQGQVERALRRLEGVLGADVMVGEISGQQLERFVFGFGFSLRTVDNYHTYLNSFFSWCVRRGCCFSNPMDALDGVDVPESEANVMPVDDVAAMFRELVSWRAFAAPFLGLSFFAGFRSSMIPRLSLGDIDFEERGITLPGTSTKTKKRFYVEGHSDNLWAWIEPLRLLSAYPKFADSTFRDWREKAYLKAAVDYPENGARDSFCSYDMGVYRDASRTATLLTHRGTSMLRRKYLGKATKTEGLRYFSIVPPGNYAELFLESIGRSKHRRLVA